MEIQKIQDGDSLTVKLSGSLDPNTAPVFLDDMVQNVDLEHTKELILDFENVDYIFSVGLRVCLQLQKIMDSYGNKVKIVNASTAVKEIFELIGFAKIINLE